MPYALTVYKIRLSDVPMDGLEWTPARIAPLFS